MSDDPLVHVVESHHDDPCRRWQIATESSRAGARIFPVVYPVPKSLWDVYEAARVGVLEAESAIDIYVEVIHNESDEWSR